ncbi:LysR family transcriptional regulator [Desulfovibrio desulfuricans]|uniref:LysR substrate-binding domain-containing protein n=1 Tax=Desulfovibrio desulfuricans TaxID=876 RepID=UPI001F2AC7D6|nr:LysR family transcriptional regulator [Desulfovibrio desulfuricans]UIB01114.1 LysR family transcriptional regulator [Desulfovibrio desulfuricans]
MEIRHLKTLMMVASARSISKASHLLHLSQPSVTRIVQEIETIVGSPLFSRTKDGMILTNDGKKFYKLATKITSSLHKTISDLKNSHKKSVINIGFCPSIMIFDLIEQLRYANFSMDYIRFHEFNTKRQLIALKNNQIDISITRGADTAHSEGLEQITLHKAELFAVIPAAHRLSGKKTLNLDEMKDDQFVTLSEKFFPFYNSTMTAICKNAGFIPRIGFSANGYVAALATIAAGSCVGIFPRGIVNSIIPGYVYIPIRARDNFIDITCYLRNGENRKEVIDIISIIRNQFCNFGLSDI